MAKSRRYEDSLYEALQDPREAIEYLNAAMEDDDPSVFLLALKDLADAHGGVTRIAETAHLNRQNLYRALSENGNPTYESLQAVLHAMGLRLSISPHEENDQRAACG